jgi:Bacterial PH domain
MKFAATTSASLKITTAVVSFLILGSAASCIIFFAIDKSIISLVIAIILIGAYIVAYAYQPQYYVVGKDDLSIKRLSSNIVIPKSAVQSVSIIHRDMLDVSLRTFGVGGLFGYYGKFSNSKLGAMIRYIKRMDSLVLITTSAEKIIVSPDDAEGFVKALG